MKKNKYIIMLAFVLMVLAILSVIFSIGINPEKEIEKNIEVPDDKSEQQIVLDNPKPNQKVKSPIIIDGKARGNWFFEASFPVFVVDWDGRIIATGVAQAKGDWMTSEFVPFEVSIPYELDIDIYSKRGAIILKKDNPSGLPENDDALEVPIEFE